MSAHDLLLRSAAQLNDPNPHHSDERLSGCQSMERHALEHNSSKDCLACSIWLCAKVASDLQPTTHIDAVSGARRSLSPLEVVELLAKRWAHHPVGVLMVRLANQLKEQHG